MNNFYDKPIYFYIEKSFVHMAGTFAYIVLPRIVFILRRWPLHEQTLDESTVKHVEETKTPVHLRLRISFYN